ncbi:nucleoporin complex subunit 54-domain-containing protein [Dactylonectria estremocensis]|uniref:Nucleoporin complex subunit 54-domain-containing protein n=1 Tax=Dactylonectria estremocensis TaxID=1079267 RepID=A0A9P9IL31_9HYPO|nr:nucleoporin complex subunit 54-domain-containing protein [Dactylonectria estremocensis]
MSLFGQAKPSLFGQSQPVQTPQPQQGNTLGVSMVQQQQTQQMPTLSQSQAQLANSLWQPGKETPHQKPILEQMKFVTEKWDPANANCVFKHYFYNKVDESHVPFYKPQAHEDPREWEEALQNKPAPGFMPVLCSGYVGVADRLKTQKRAVSDFNTRLHQVNGSLDAILQRHELQTEVRAVAARRRQTTISERCLALAARVQVLRNRGYALSGDEDDLNSRLQNLEREVQDPAVGAREEELWSRLIILRSYADQLNREMDKPSGGDGESLDPETEGKAKRVLEDYEKQIQHLKKELEALGVDYTEWEKTRNPHSRSR